MWQSEPVEGNEDLRQGDLLVDVLIPRLKAPMRVTHVPGEKPAPGDLFALQAVKKTLLVVSQCCTIENGEYVALAPIGSTGSLTEQMRQGLVAEEPPAEGEEGAYVFDMFRLEPIEGVVEETHDRFQVAHLPQIFSIRGGREELLEKRTARMTPQGRLLLRRKLSFFWARPEAEDQAILDGRT